MRCWMRFAARSMGCFQTGSVVPDDNPERSKHPGASDLSARRRRQACGPKIRPPVLRLVADSAVNRRMKRLPCATGMERSMATAPGRNLSIVDAVEEVPTLLGPLSAHTASSVEAFTPVYSRASVGTAVEVGILSSVVARACSTIVVSATMIFYHFQRALAFRLSARWFTRREIAMPPQR